MSAQVNNMPPRRVRRGDVAGRLARPETYGLRSRDRNRLEALSAENPVRGHQVNPRGNVVIIGTSPPITLHQRDHDYPTPAGRFVTEDRSPPSQYVSTMFKVFSESLTAFSTRLTAFSTMLKVCSTMLTVVQYLTSS